MTTYPAPYFHESVDYKQIYRWEYDLENSPDSIKIKEYVNDRLSEVTEVREKVVVQAGIAILRAKGYIVIEPEGEGDV